MLVHLDARERQEVIDQAAHALRLALHESQELLLRPRVALGGTLDRFEEAREGGERGSQLMAGIGHEIGTHALDLLFARQVAQHNERALARPEAGDMGAEGARHRHADLIVDARTALARRGGGNGLQHVGHAQRR